MSKERESFEDTRNRQMATMQWQDILAFADVDVKGKVLFKKFIAGTPLENDIPVWMAEYAGKYQQAAEAHYQPLLAAKDAEIAHMDAVIGEMQPIEAMITLQDENTALKALLEHAREAKDSAYQKGRDDERQSWLKMKAGGFISYVNLRGNSA